MGNLKRRQQGLSLTGLIFVAIILVLLAVLGMKVGPAYFDYFTILNDVKATANDQGLAGSTVQQIRAAYTKRVIVSGIKDVSGEDLDVTKENGAIVISFSYSKQIPLLDNVSLVINFEGSSSASSNSIE